MDFGLIHNSKYNSEYNSPLDDRPQCTTFTAGTISGTNYCNDDAL